MISESILSRVMMNARRQVYEPSTEPKRAESIASRKGRRIRATYRSKGLLAQRARVRNRVWRGKRSPRESGLYVSREFRYQLPHSPPLLPSPFPSLPFSLPGLIIPYSALLISLLGPGLRLISRNRDLICATRRRLKSAPREPTRESWDRPFSRCCAKLFVEIVKVLAITAGNFVLCPTQRDVSPDECIRARSSSFRQVADAHVSSRRCFAHGECRGEGSRGSTLRSAKSRHRGLSRFNRTSRILKKLDLSPESEMKRHCADSVSVQIPGALNSSN